MLKIDGAYHLFTSEMVGEPMWLKMKIAHWISTDGKAFTRRSTLFESSGNYDGSDERAPAEIRRVTLNGQPARRTTAQGVPFGPGKTVTWQIS